MSLLSQTVPHRCGFAERVSRLNPGSASLNPQKRGALPASRRYGAPSARKPLILVKAASAEAGYDPFAGVALYKPETYDALVQDAARSVAYALKDKKLKIEVEFPPLPSSVSGYKGASDDFIDANLQLAFALARKLKESEGIVSRLVVPDGPEKRRAARILKSAFLLEDGIFLGSLDDVPGGPGSGFLGSIKNILDLDFGEQEEGSWLSPTAKVQLHIVVNSSATELPAVQKYLDHFASDTPAVLFNLELDTLRADLGLFGFPQKDVHYDFLSFFTPAFYIRTRDYSKSVAVAPFVLNYSGALLRQYPGPWQVMLKQSDGSYACIAEKADRFTLGEVKQELLISLGLEEEVGSTMAFLRQGYKASTWWEDNLDLESSDAWRK